jgi:hypothetical protein
MNAADELYSEIQRRYVDALIDLNVDIVNRRDKGKTLVLGYPTGSGNTGFLSITKMKRGIKLKYSEYVERVDREIDLDVIHYDSIDAWMEFEGYEPSAKARRVSIKRTNWRN